MNKVILMGRLTSDPQLKETTMKVASFTLAVERINKDKADFINCKAFRNTAEQLAKWVKKGQRVLIEGKWHTDSYDTENGKRYVNECLVDHFEFVEKADKVTTKFVDRDGNVLDEFYSAPDGGLEF